MSRNIDKEIKRENREANLDKLYKKAKTKKLRAMRREIRESKVYS